MCRVFASRECVLDETSSDGTSSGISGQVCSFSDRSSCHSRERNQQQHEHDVHFISVSSGPINTAQRFVTRERLPALEASQVFACQDYLLNGHR
jgi:hypothetical protein